MMQNTIKKILASRSALLLYWVLLVLFFAANGILQIILFVPLLPPLNHQILLKASVVLGTLHLGYHHRPPFIRSIDITRNDSEGMIGDINLSSMLSESRLFFNS